MLKAKAWWRRTYDDVNKTAFYICLFTSISLLTAGFCTPPVGDIRRSVLLAVGELFAFATLGTVIAAVTKGSDVTISKGDMSVKIDNPDPDTEDNKLKHIENEDE